MQNKSKSEYPLVSIFCGCKNCAKTIRRCINSIIAQDYPNIEIIVQDGASTDGTLEILQEYGNKIKLVSEPDSEPWDGFFRALKRVRGEFFGSCLSDEELLPHAASWAVENLTKYPEVAAIYGDHYVTDIDGNITGQVRPSEWNFEKFLINREGKVIARFEPKTEPDSKEVVTAIENAIQKLTSIEELGKRMFFDISLSEPTGQSCSSSMVLMLAGLGRIRTSMPTVLYTREQ